jgi:L-alanine-DL-glutamate epimerase-like enolase superfamily enzyme
MTWHLEELHLELDFDWRIARGSTTFKTNFFVHLKVGETTFSGEVAPNLRYGETPELIRHQFAHFFVALPPVFSRLEAFDDYLASLSLCKSLHFGLESAFLHYWCRKQQISLCQFLDVPAPLPGQVTAFTLPIMEPAQMEAFIRERNLKRFQLLKVKISQEGAEESLRRVHQLSSGKPLMVDANEAWTDPDELLRFLERTRDLPLLFLEQPMPAALTSQYQYLRQHSFLPLIADESVTDSVDWTCVASQFHGINMKLMKAGGYRRGLSLLQQARQAGLQTMIGCMVETSLGIASALHLSQGVDFLDLDSFLYLQQDPVDLITDTEGRLSLKQSF